MITPFQALACPLDGTDLHRHENTWQCASGHNFDISSQGYVHLLPVQMKRSRDPGDSKEMVASRRRFLSSGVYDPIANATSATILRNTPANSTIRCLDAGCGEGHYLRCVAAGSTPGIALVLAGLDISKWAIQAAAKRDKQTTWLVGSNANLPIQSASLDWLLCMFGFPVYAEFARVLAPHGQLLQVDAGPQHLRELREIIYPTLKPERAGNESDPPGFKHVGSETLSYSLELTSAEQIADLLAMTPHLFRASADGLAKLKTLDRLSVTVDVRLARFKVMAFVLAD
ncbi:methyltransferase domain-containing protein [Alcaligenaceae bacterium]|nr:methyltransferase domain-containing protein [Alcaligenaceae bacterium]